MSEPTAEEPKGRAASARKVSIILPPERVQEPAAPATPTTSDTSSTTEAVDEAPADLCVEDLLEEEDDLTNIENACVDGESSEGTVRSREPSFRRNPSLKKGNSSRTIKPPQFTPDEHFSAFQKQRQNELIDDEIRLHRYKKEHEIRELKEKQAFWQRQLLATLASSLKFDKMQRDTTQMAVKLTQLYEEMRAETDAMEAQKHVLTPEDIAMLRIRSALKLARSQRRRKLEEHHHLPKKDEKKVLVRHFESFFTRLQEQFTTRRNNRALEASMSLNGWSPRRNLSDIPDVGDLTVRELGELKKLQRACDSNNTGFVEYSDIVHLIRVLHERACTEEEVNRVLLMIHINPKGIKPSLDSFLLHGWRLFHVWKGEHFFPACPGDIDVHAKAKLAAESQQRLVVAEGKVRTEIQKNSALKPANWDEEYAQGERHKELQEEMVRVRKEWAVSAVLLTPDDLTELHKRQAYREASKKRRVRPAMVLSSGAVTEHTPRLSQHASAATIVYPRPRATPRPPPSKPATAPRQREPTRPANTSVPHTYSTALCKDLLSTRFPDTAATESDDRESLESLFQRIVTLEGTTDCGDPVTATATLTPFHMFSLLCSFSELGASYDEAHAVLSACGRPRGSDAWTVDDFVNHGIALRNKVDDYLTFSSLSQRAKSKRVCGKVTTGEILTREEGVWWRGQTSLHSEAAANKTLRLQSRFPNTNPDAIAVMATTSLTATPTETDEPEQSGVHTAGKHAPRRPASGRYPAPKQRHPLLRPATARTKSSSAPNPFEQYSEDAEFRHSYLVESDPTKRFVWQQSQGNDRLLDHLTSQYFPSADLNRQKFRDSLEARRKMATEEVRGVW